MDTDDYPSMATFSSQRRLPNSIQLNTTTLEDQTTSTQSHRITSSQRGGAEISSSRHHSDFTLSNFFTIQEPNKRRLILDCQKLNTYIQCHHFKMEGIPALREIMEKNDFICKLDLKDAYVVVGLHPQSRKYLTLMNQGIVYQYKTLAFGMSVSPRVFSKMMRFAVEQLRKEGIRLVYYLDDICLLAQTKEEMHKVCTRYINSIAQTGLSGVYFQLNQYENYGACQENQQIGQSNQASSSTTNSFLQVVCKPNGKNGIHDSSNWGGALTHQILAEGPCSQLTTTSPEAGSTIHTLDQQQSRITMVDELCHRQEWTADTKDRQPKASNYDPRSQQRNIMALDLYDDVTIIELYTVAKNETEKHAGASESQLNALATICSTSENQFKKIRNLLKGELPANSKVLKYVNQDVDYHSKLKRKYEEIVFEDKDETTTPMEEPAEIKVIESVVQDPLTDEEITFIENFISKKNGKMSWKICWETGSRVGYFKRYGNGESLRVTYSRVRKNLK
ncbi:hypothetical protein G6F42_009291 [Rhizopus arrhizus]|nr:hypothetical protein G6F42_009291 [Rhizopus arrhizus]